MLCLRDDDIRRERAEYIPDISLQLSYISIPNISFVPKNIVSAGFLMQWQPFDWGQKKHKIAAAVAAAILDAASGGSQALSTLMASITP